MNPVVIAWVALSGGGLLLSLYLARESWLDLRVLGDLLNGRRWAARSRFAREGLRMTVHWTWLLMGVSVLLEIRLGPLIVLGLLYGNVVLVTNSLIDARTRFLLFSMRGKEPDLPHP